MTESITFQLGPIAVRIEGDPLIARWARRTFEAAATTADPTVLITVGDDQVQLNGPTDVGDEKARVGCGAMTYRLRLFDVCLRREGDRWLAHLGRRDRRALWRRGLTDPEEAWKTWLSHGASLDVHLLKSFAYTVCPLVLQCALLEHGAALVHAGGLEMDGRAVLLPAWGGVGKSMVVSRAVLHGRAGFLADDHAVLGGDGTVHLHLLPMHVYATAVAQDPRLADRLLASLTPAGRRQWRLGARLRPRRAVRWISPVRLFGRGRLGGQARLEQVIVMFRAQRDSFVWERLGAADAARPCAGVIAEEINGFGDRLALANAGWAAPVLPDPGQAYRAVREVYEKAFSHASCARVLIPRHAAAGDVMAFLRRHSPLIDQAMA